MAEHNDTDKQDRTEKPSEYRREEFRKKGSVATSRELTGTLLLLGAGYTMWLSGSGTTESFRNLCEMFFRFEGAEELSRAFLAAKQAEAFGVFIRFVAPVFFASCLVGLAVGIAQAGFYWTWEPIAPNWDRINPLSGIKRILSLQSIFDSVKSLFKIGIVAVVLYLTVSKTLNFAPLLLERSVAELVPQIASEVFATFQKICAALLLVAGVDYAWSRYRLEKQMKMTKKEVRDELKLREGDPTLKARIRSAQRRLASKRMMQEVPKADVVITNPTHFAVALRYDDKTMVAPRVVAKGMDFLALRIRELAKRSDVPIVENKLLARKLYKEIPVGKAIHRDLYKAVAQVLAYVYRVRHAAKTAA